MSDVESGIHISTEDAPDRPALTRPVSAGLREVTAGERPYLRVARGTDEWIQARHLPDGAYRLTHHRDPESDEYELYTADPIMVRDIVFAWLDRDPWWTDRVAWSRIDPSVAELESMRGEIAEMLEGFDLVGVMTGVMDDALARAEELLGTDFDDLGPMVLESGEHDSVAFDTTGPESAASGPPGVDFMASGADEDDPFARLDALLAMDPDSFGSDKP